MSIKSTAIGLGIGLLVSTGAMAAGRYGYGNGSEYSGLYVGASAGEVLYNEEGLNQMAPTILLLHIGQQFSPFVAIEGRLGTSVNGGSADGYHINGQLLYGGYIKGMLPLNPWFSPYAIVGLGGAQWHRNYPDYNTNDVAVSYGVGGDFNLGGGASLNLEWARLTTGNNVGYDYNADQLTFGINWHL
jgi:hypothetical protein